MNIDDLQAFLAVAKAGSFSIAGERLHLTQPAISKRIASLERSLGVTLFDRFGRKITLTEAGQALQEKARHILEDVADIHRVIANLAGEIRGPLTIGTSHHIGLHRLPPLLQRYVESYPAVHLDLHFMDSEAACRAVAQGELEIGVVTLPPLPPERLKITPIWNDTLALVCNRKHPLAANAVPSLTQLSEYAAILPGRGTYTREIFEAAIKAHNVTLKTAIETNYMETIRMMISIGLGWGLLPQSMLDERFHILTIPTLTMTRTLGMVEHTERTPSNAARRFVELLASAKENI